MKVKELAEVIYPACSIFVEDPYDYPIDTYPCGCCMCCGCDCDWDYDEDEDWEDE